MNKMQTLESTDYRYESEEKEEIDRRMGRDTTGIGSRIEKKTTLGLEIGDSNDMTNDSPMYVLYVDYLPTFGN